MAKNKLEILVTAATDKAVKAFKKLDKSIEDTGKKSKDTGKKLGFLDGVMLSLGGMATNFALNIAKGIPQLFELGIEADRAKLALEGYAGGAEIAVKYTEAVERAAGGAISEMDAMKNAAKLLSMGLATNTDEAAKLTEIAITLGASMGKGPTQAFEEFTLMLANQSIPRLDTFGISASKVRERIKELQDETEGLDRQQAFLIATMEIAEGKLDQLDAAGFKATSSVDKLGAATDNLKVSFGLLMADGLEPVLDHLFLLEEASQDAHDEALALTDTYEEYLDMLFDLQGGSANLWNSTEDLTESQYDLAKAVEVGEITMDGWMGGIQDSIVTVEDAEIAIRDYKAAMSELNMYVNGKIGPAIERFEEKNEDLRGSIYELEQGIARLENQRYLTPEQNEQLGAMKQKLGEQKTAVEELAAAHELAMKKILFSLLSQQAESLDEVQFLADIAEGWGIIDEDTRNAFQTAGDAMSQFRSGDAEGARETIQGMGTDLGITETAAEEAKDEVNLFNRELALMPTSKVVDIYVRTIHQTYGTPSGYGRQNLPQGYQHGGSFIVGGQGVDQTPVSFMATRGERVDITPSGGKGGAGAVINLTYAPAFSLGDREEMETHFIPFLNDALRRAGVAQ